jgi:hypothetical protein
MTTAFRMIVALVVSVLLGAVGVDVAAQQAAVSAAACTVAALQAKSPQGTTIVDAKIVEATDTVPQYCDLNGHATSVGNEVDFRLALPATWNGKFFFAGVGGLGGSTDSRGTVFDSSIIESLLLRRNNQPLVTRTIRTGAPTAPNKSTTATAGRTSRPSPPALSLRLTTAGRRHAYFQGLLERRKQALMGAALPRRLPTASLPAIRRRAP